MARVPTPASVTHVPPLDTPRIRTDTWSVFGACFRLPPEHLQSTIPMAPMPISFTITTFCRNCSYMGKNAPQQQIKR